MITRQIMKIKLPEELDRRFKATKRIRTMIIDDYITGNYDINMLSEKYNLSRKTIIRVLKPEIKEKEKEYKRKYNQTHDRNAVRARKNQVNYYNYKLKLYKEGKLNEN